MAEFQFPIHLSPTDATLDAPTGANSTLPKSARAKSARGNDQRTEAGAKVKLVTGSACGIATETESLLRDRLRAAVTVLFLASLAILPRDLILGATQTARDFADFRFAHHLFFGAHLVHVAILGTLATLLWGRWLCYSMRKLRAMELLTFISTAVLFIVGQHAGALLLAHSHDSVPVATGWCLLMLTYAMFIPTCWVRLAYWLGIFVAASLSMYAIDMAAFDVVRQTATIDSMVTLPLVLLISYGTSVYGCYTIVNLRQEAFSAKQLGQYRLRHLLGEGGMGEVYFAEHQLLKRPCAIKIIRPAKAADPTALARFEREVRATATLTHWNTVEIFDYGSTEDGTFYYVMEYLPGLSLADLVTRHGPLAPERVIHLLSQAADALSEAHNMGLMHRDIKPQNIFAAHRGGVYDVTKLLDFGLAKPLMHTEAMQLTQEGSITGSPLYMSPEQVLGEEDPDGRSDLYSLGAVGYYLLTGQPPFMSDQPLRVLMSHVHDPVVPPSELRSEIPHDLEAILLKCLAKRPEDRFQNAADLQEAFNSCESAHDWTRQRAAAWWNSAGTATAAAPEPVAAT